MTLAFCRDLSAADWLVRSDLPWQQLVCFGPAGFEAYARLRFLPDPARAGMSEADAEANGRLGQMDTLLDVLAGRTATPGECCFCVWEGFGDFAPAREDPPRVVLPHRAYWLFRGPLDEVGRWDEAEGRPAGVRLDGAEPAFVWPADRAWCVARDVDPHWAGIGASRSSIDLLTADPRLDVVPADPSQEQPAYE